MITTFHEYLTRLSAIVIALLLVIAPVNALPGSSCFFVPAEEEDEQIELLADNRIAEPSRAVHNLRLTARRTVQLTPRSHHFAMGSMPMEPTPAPFDTERNLRLHC